MEVNVGSSISFYCGIDDNAALEAQIEALGLLLVPMRTDQSVAANPKDGPFCYLSPVPADQLHPYGDPPINLSEATDPLIEFLRAYYDPPYLVSGRLYWSDDVKSLAAATKGPYGKLVRWVRANWKLLPGSSFYFGPQAAALFQTAGAIPSTFAPNVTIPVNEAGRFHGGKSLC